MTSEQKTNKKLWSIDLDQLQSWQNMHTIKTGEIMKEYNPYIERIKKEKLYLRNRSLEQDPNNQKQSPLYKKIRDHIKKTGEIINPLLVVEDGDLYKVVCGNNRYLSGLELGFTEFPIQVLKDEEVNTIKEAVKNYKEINLDEI